VNAAAQGRLVRAVQANCHIADARHAADMPLCSYLLQMREFFRWEQGLTLGAALSREHIGAWIAERETLWASLEAQDFARLPASGPGDDLDPFDVAAVNAQLRPAGLLYGAGLVGSARPVFFLAERHAEARRDGVEVTSAGRELARGLVAPPAALGQAAGQPFIVLRREALARWCWEKYEAFALRRTPGTAFHAVVQAYGLDADLDAGLARCVDEQTETLVLHELGEHRAGQQLGPAWARMRLALPTRRAELYVRALRDHLADLGLTLPTLLARTAPAPLHFWFANFEGVREALFPSLKAAYAAWCHGDGGQALQQAVERGESHFAALARQVLALHESRGEQAGTAIEQLLTAPGAVAPA
jgi:hypothetical protein